MRGERERCQSGHLVQKHASQTTPRHAMLMSLFGLAVHKKLLETQPTDIQIKSDFKISSYTTSGSIQNLENLEEITESTISSNIPMFLSWGGIHQILTPKLKLW